MKGVGNLSNTNCHLKEVIQHQPLIPHVTPVINFMGDRRGGRGLKNEFHGVMKLLGGGGAENNPLGMSMESLSPFLLVNRFVSKHDSS